MGAAAAGARAQDSGSLPLREVWQAEPAALPAPGSRPFLGVVLRSSSPAPRVLHVVAASPAKEAGIVPGDALESLGGRHLAVPDDLDRALVDRVPGDSLDAVVQRGGRRLALRVRLGTRTVEGSGIHQGPDFRLAVVEIRFAGEAGDDARVRALGERLLGRTGLRGPGATLADYYEDQSRGRLTVRGRVLRALDLPAERRRFAALPMGGGSRSLFGDAARRLFEREGASALEAFDGIAFLYAGGPAPRPGTALWPHRSMVPVNGRRIPYYVHPVGESGGDTIGVHCHEFGHLLGLADEYGHGHRTGSGDFCLMAIGHRGGGTSGANSPFSLCAPCRMRLRWTDAAVVDPRVAQRLRIRPPSAGASGTVVVSLDPRTKQYLVLEVRQREGFDRELPSAGLVVWHVGGPGTPGQGPYRNEVDLVEAHGVDSFEAALVRPAEIAFPTARARELTPFTRPSVQAPPGGFSVHLTDIVRLPDGSVAVTLGRTPVVRQALPRVREGEIPTGHGGTVVRTDPVTGEQILFRLRGAAAPPARTSRER